jgi:hypothetical protein
MTFTAREVTIGTVAVAIGTATPKNTHELTLGNDYNKSIYVGAADVAVGAGYAVSKANVVKLRIADGDILYAISDAAGSNLHIYDFQVDP